MPSAVWPLSPYPLHVGRARFFTLGQFAEAMGQVAHYDEFLGRSYDQLDLAEISRNFQWQAHRTGRIFDFFDPKAPNTRRTLQFKTAALPEIIDLTESELQAFRQSNAKYYLRFQLIQIFQKTDKPKHFNGEYYAWEKRLRRGQKAEEFFATLPALDTHKHLQPIHLTFKTPVGSRFDNLLKTDLLNLIVFANKRTPKQAVAVVVSTLQKLGQACALKYDFQGYNPTPFVRLFSLAEKHRPPQYQQITFLTWQTRCLQELVHVYLRALHRVVLESLPPKRRESLRENPYTLRPEEFTPFIPENLARLLLVEDTLQKQILKLSRTILEECPVKFELLGVQVKSSRTGLNKHVHRHGYEMGVIRPPSSLVHFHYSRQTPLYTQQIERSVHAYAKLHRLS